MAIATKKKPFSSNFTKDIYFFLSFLFTRIPLYIPEIRNDKGLCFCIASPPYSLLVCWNNEKFPIIDHLEDTLFSMATNAEVGPPNNKKTISKSFPPG